MPRSRGWDFIAAKVREIDEHNAELRALALHEEIGERLLAGAPEADVLLAHARRIVDQWERGSDVQAGHIALWRQILDLPADQMLPRMLIEDGHYPSFRMLSPWRAVVRSEVRARAKSSGAPV